MTYHVTLIPGDGTGPELVEATRRVLEATGISFQWEIQEAGEEVMAKEGTPLPDRVLDSIKRNGVALRAHHHAHRQRLSQRERGAAPRWTSMPTSARRGACPARHA